MATSIFVYNLTPSTSKLAADIYKTLSNIPDDGPNYFNLQLLNENELSGEYVIVQTVEESFYNPIDRVFEQRKASKATIVGFRFLYNGIIIKHQKTEPTYTKTSLFLCEKRRFFMARREKGVVPIIYFEKERGKSF